MKIRIHLNIIDQLMLYFKKDIKIRVDLNNAECDERVL